VFCFIQVIVSTTVSLKLSQAQNAFHMNYYTYHYQTRYCADCEIAMCNGTQIQKPDFPGVQYGNPAFYAQSQTSRVDAGSTAFWNVLNFDVPYDVSSIAKGLLTFFGNVTYAQSPNPRKEMKLTIGFVVDSPFYFRTGSAGNNTFYASPHPLDANGQIQWPARCSAPQKTIDATITTSNSYTFDVSSLVRSLVLKAGSRLSLVIISSPTATPFLDVLIVKFTTVELTLF